MKLAANISSVLLITAVFTIAYYTPRTLFNQLVLLFGLAYLAYAIILIAGKQFSLKLGIVIAIFLRVILLFSMPALSDDIYRFLWDGLLLVNGINPFSILPDTLFEQGLPSFLNESLYNSLNSRKYFTVYPPFAQSLFAIGAWISGKDVFMFNIVLKVFFLIAECTTIYFLFKCLKLLKINPSRLLYYALNPLIIIELTVNLHFEVFLITFFVISIYFILKRSYIKGSVFLALSVLSKMVSLIFLPFSLVLLKFRDWVRFCLISCMLIIIAFIPFLLGFNLQHFMSSLDLYFRSFEFNASIYYLVRAIGHQLVGYNLIAWIGPVLAFLSFSIILLLSWCRVQKDPELVLRRFSWALFIYLLLSTTVHPWYLSLLILLAPMSGHRFPLFWSFLVILSYYAYTAQPFAESNSLLVLEYLLVGLFILFEWKIMDKYKYLLNKKS